MPNSSRKNCGTRADRIPKSLFATTVDRKNVVTTRPLTVSPATVAKAYQANELMLVNIMPDHAARRYSYELVAREYGLAGASASA